MNSQVKNLLIVAESIDVEDSSGTKGRVALIDNLHKAGYNLRVYHYTKKIISLEGIKTYPLKENRRSLLFLLSRLERHIRYKFNYSLNVYIERIFGFSFTLLNDRNSIARELERIEDFNPDLVLTLSKGGSFRPHHALLNLPKWHNKWIAYIHDPYPMHSYPRPYDWVEPGHQRKRDFFQQVALKCKYAAYPSKLLSEWMESYFPELKGKRLIIPHQINSTKDVTEEIPLFFKEEGFSIVHAGALMGARNPIGLLNAFQEFLKQNPEAKEHSQLLFLGERSRYTKVFNEVIEEMPQLYCSNRNLPFSMVKAIQNKASVNVILEAKGPISPFLPGKFPHCIQSKQPILLLGPFYSECRRLLGENYPWYSEIDDRERILQHIKSLYVRWQNKDKMEVDYSGLKEYLSVSYLKVIIDDL
ncbi:hypothetical protein [Christiangramia echinicola]|uniref:hypothetical protein n=1 Tax=Christiangramia echinicola TaxID=279359 RepID=UPI000B7EBF00|nr:hypothetical protein [Christiangramia echinicola]